MKHLALLFCIWFELNLARAAAAQEFYPDFALVVQLPSYETFLKNLGNLPIRVDGYQISSPSGSLSPINWTPLDFAGPEIVAALGPGANQFFVANPNANSLAELNPLSSAIWQPSQIWSIGFPFNSHDPDVLLGTVFKFSSPDGFVLTGGTVVPPSGLFPAAIIVVPEPTSGILCLLATAGALRCAPDSIEPTASANPLDSVYDVHLRLPAWRRLTQFDESQSI